MNCRLIIIVAVMIMTMTGCHQEAQKLEAFNVEVYSPKNATGFRIIGAKDKSSVIIESKNPWQGASDASKMLYVQRDNEPVPTGFKGEILKKIPERIITMSSTQIAMLESLCSVDKIVGVSGLQFITNENIKNRTHKIADVGYDGNINYELIMGINPDLIMLYGVTGASPMENKLHELGIPYIYIGEYLEESPVGKVEWVRVIGEIVGKSTAADSVINAVESEYNYLRNKVANVPARPKVMVNLPYGDSWFMPSTRSYLVTLIEDAGGNYIYKENNSNSSVPIDMEKAYQLVSESDVWLNPGNVKNISDMVAGAKRFMDLPIIKECRVYNNNKRNTADGGNDFYESGAMNPHIILKDLIKIFHPEVYIDDNEMTYYTRLEK